MRGLESHFDIVPYWGMLHYHFDSLCYHDIIAARKIEQAFAKHGIRPRNVWGE